MNPAFNSDVRIGDTLYHVETEDHGTDRPFIDTTVYVKGRVLHRRTSSYQDLLGPDGPSASLLQQRVESQHRGVIEELRSGELKLDAAGAAQTRGIKVQLLNADRWLAGRAVTLKVAVYERRTRRPLADADLQVMLEGAQTPLRFAARTNPQGCAEVTFLLPRLTAAGGTLVIHAATPAGQDEIRFQIRAKVLADVSPSSPK